jgi:tetratricopeptide (TPR) repeat protein
MLQRFAWLSPEPIPESLMDVSVPGITATAGNPFDSLAELETYSLVTRASDTHSFGVHRLIQEVTRRGQTNNGALIEAVAWIDNAFTTGDPSNVASWPTLDPLLPHGQAVSIYADQTGILLPTARLMGHVGMMLLAKARYQEALPFLRRTLELDEAFFGTDSLCVAVDLNNLAQLLHKTGRVAEAELHTRRALAISERKLGRTHQSLVPVLNNLATLLCEKNPDDTTEAQTHMERALAIAGQRYPDVEALMNNLGALLQTAGDFPEAEKLFRDALAIAERRRGKNHPVVAHCLNNLADLLRLSSRSSDAEPLMRRALAIQESNFAPDHPNIATVLNNLAGLLQHTTEGLAESARDGRLAVAEQLVERALAIDELKLGPNHVNVGRDLNTLAGVFHIAGRFPQAELLFKRALSIVVPALGVNHWSCRHVQERFANLLRAMGKTDSEIDEELRNACASPGRRR